MSERRFEQSNDAEYRKGYYDGQHDAFAAVELVDATLLEAYSLLFVTSTTKNKASSEDEE